MKLTKLPKIICAALLCMGAGPVWAQSTSDIGKVLGADGKMYKTAIAATNAGTTASGIIAYWGAAGSVESGNNSYRGMAIALEDAVLEWGSRPNHMEYCTSNDHQCSTATSYCSTVSEALSAKNGIAATQSAIENNGEGHWHNAAGNGYYVARPSGASMWAIPSMGQWQLMAQGLTGNSSSLSDTDNPDYHYNNLSTKINVAGGTYLEWLFYWSSTEKDASSVWCFNVGGLEFGRNGSRASAFAQNLDDGYMRVRMFFAFSSATAAVYTISYDANGGSDAPSSQTKDGGIDITLSNSTLTRAGFTHTGWNTNANGTGTHYDKGATFTGNSNTTLYAEWSFQGSGTENDPYRIPSTDVWNFLSEKVAAGNTYSGKFFRQTADISINTRVGNYTDNVNNRRPFSGTYDGDGHTLTVTLSGSIYIAPFGYTNTATIKNLHTAGTISATAKHAAGVCGVTYTLTITNCRSSVAISSTVNGDCTSAGFVGRVGTGNGNTDYILIENSVFDGSFNGNSVATNWGGFVGWNYSNHLTIRNCYCAPSSVSVNYVDENSPFCRYYRSDAIPTITSCYYNTVAANKLLGNTYSSQGKRAYNITGASGVTVTPANAETYYSVSGITSYGTGISYGGVLYGGSGDAISLNLTHADAPVGYSFSQYTADNGTVTGSGNPYTLTMADANAVIAAEWEVNPSVSLSDNDATMPSILSALNDGNARDITINRPLLRNGDYNTLCVPFSLSAEQLADADCPLYNCAISQLTDMWVAGNELRLLMSPVSSIEAGKPYLVRYKGETTKLTEMVFSGVTVSASEGSTTNANGATMYGVLEPTNLDVGNTNVLFLVSGNQLNWPNADSPIKSFRAYFVVDGSNNGGSAPVRRGMLARIVEHYDTATDVEAVGGQQSAVSCQKVLRDGQLIIIRNGVEYNAMGQIIK